MTATPVDNNLREKLWEEIEGLEYCAVQHSKKAWSTEAFEKYRKIRYEAILALITHSNNAARIDELSRVSNARGLHAVTFNYITKRVAQLQATEGRSEPDSVGTTDVSQATNALLDRLKEGMGEILINQPLTYKRISDLLEAEREKL